MSVPTSLADVRRKSDVEAFPTYAFLANETALVLFAAGFYGTQDAIHVVDAGLDATCVDIRPEKLAVMRDLYPEGWEFIEGDAFAYAEMTTRKWDVVTVDCPSGAFVRAAKEVGLWCKLANEYVILGSGSNTPLKPPAGWTVWDSRKRSEFSGGTFWTVLMRL